jgi:hypothetical protein
MLLQRQLLILLQWRLEPITTFRRLITISLREVPNPLQRIQ